MTRLGKASRILATTLSALCLSLAFAPVEAEILQPGGSRVAIDVPDGFELSGKFTGIQHDGGCFLRFCRIAGRCLYR